MTSGAERERELEREAEQEDPLRGEAGRERAVVQQPLEVLLQGERDRREQREEPRGRRRAARAAEHGERAPSQGGAEQRGRDGGEQWYDVQVVAVAGLREVVRALHRIGDGEPVREVVAGQQSGGEERRDERPREAGSRHGRQAPIGRHSRQGTPRRTGVAAHSARGHDEQQRPGEAQEAAGRDRAELVVEVDRHRDVAPGEARADGSERAQQTRPRSGGDLPPRPPRPPTRPQS